MAKRHLNAAAAIGVVAAVGALFLLKSKTAAERNGGTQSAPTPLPDGTTDSAPEAAATETDAKEAKRLLMREEKKKRVRKLARLWATAVVDASFATQDFVRRRIKLLAALLMIAANIHLLIEDVLFFSEKTAEFLKHHSTALGIAGFVFGCFSMLFVRGAEVFKLYGHITKLVRFRSAHAVLTAISFIIALLPW